MALMTRSPRRAAAFSNKARVTHRRNTPFGFKRGQLSIPRYLAKIEQEVRAEGRNPISLAGGKPNMAAYSMREYDANAKAYLERQALTLLDDADTTLAAYAAKGYWGLRDYIANYTASTSYGFVREDFARILEKDWGKKVDPKRLVPMNGNTQAIDVLLRYFNSLANNENGKPVAVFMTNPVYAGALSPLADYPNIKVYGIDIDEKGINPNSLQEAMEEALADGYQLGFTYLVPDGDNPSGITMDQERRDEVYEVIARMDEGYLFEDAPYTYLQLDPEQEYPLPFFADDPADIVIHAFTASKIGVPDPRVGWMYLPMDMHHEEDGEAVSFAAELVAPFSRQVLMQSSHHLAKFNGQAFNPYTGELVGLWPAAQHRNRIYRLNRDTLYGALQMGLAAEFGDLFQLSPLPMSGFVFTLDMPKLKELTQMDAAQLSTKLIYDYDVIVTPMDGFYGPDAPEGSGEQSIRFAYSAESAKNLLEGARRLIRGLREIFNLPEFEMSQLNHLEP